MPRHFLPLLALLLVAVPARPAAPFRIAYEPWTIDDVVEQESATGFRFSADGKFVVWVKSTPDKEKNAHIGHLFRTELATGKQVQLTRGPDGCSSPRYSPKGGYVAFLSDRKPPKSKDDKSGKRRAKDDDEPKTQIWLLDPTGGEPWHLTESTRSVASFGWANEDTLVYAAQEDAGRRETVLKDDKKDDSAVVEDERHEPPVRLFEVDVKSKKVTRISDNKDRIESLAVSPDGKFVVAQHARSLRYVYDNKVKPILVLHDVETGKSRRVFDDPRMNVSSIRWAPSGAGFYVTNERNSKPDLAQAGVTELHFHDLKSGKESKLDLDWPRGLAGGEEALFAPLGDGFLALLANGTHYRAARYTVVNGKCSRVWLAAEHMDRAFGLFADGQRIVYGHTTASQPVRWYHARVDGAKIVEPKSLAPLNDGLKKKRLARSEIVRWKGARDEEVEGILYYPHEFVPGTKAPLVVQIHGGPASADLDSWDDGWAYAANLFCQRGAFVLKPNYHGSTGYGLPWVESIANGNYCDLEVVDIEKGVDALIARGLVDANRLGLQGWSNGAILTNVLITKTTRYKAASAGAGTVEYVSDWASCEFGDAFDRFYLGKRPLEDPQLYFRKSPVYQFGKVTTPTLIFFGTEDRVVHPQQGWVQYRAMQALGKAPVRFVQFPGAKHSLKKLSHQKRKLEEEMAWFDRHLFAKEKPADLVLKDDSPLAWLLKKQSAKKVGKLLGDSVNSTLTPETVKHGKVNVGRFEVTQAQWSAFDAKWKVEPGKENHPVFGIAFEQAKMYCVWLSKVTGRKYRLPTEDESEELYEKSESGENTLDAWAGYTLNPEDAATLREKLTGMPVGTLLREAGSGRGSGKEEMVFDVGGNVAEWVVGKDGKGVLKGGSADRAADAREKATVAGLAYRGLRVVRE